MMSGRIYIFKSVFIVLFLSAFLVISPGLTFASSNKSFVKKIKIIGNTLIDSYDLEKYLDLGNGVTMTPEVMDMVISELRANYQYHGYPSIEAYSILKTKNGVMTIKVDEKNEFRWGKPRAERAVLKRAFLNNITLKEERKKQIIETLLKGYQKQKKIEEIVAGFLVGKQRERIEKIESEHRAAMRKKIADKVKDFKKIQKSIEENEAKRIETMRNRILSAGLEKFDDSITSQLDQESLEYTDLDEFLDNVMFEEMLHPGL